MLSFKRHTIDIPPLNYLKKLYFGNKYFALSIIFLGLITGMLIEIHNHRFWQSDFKVFYKAANRLLKGETLDKGNNIDGFYRYKYSPPGAIYFIPFAILPLPLAKVAYWIFLSLIICFGFYLIIRLCLPNAPPKTINNTVFLGSLILIAHIQRELHLGQVNHLLLVLYILALYFYMKGKDIQTSLIIAMTVFLKPFGLIFIPYFLVKKNFRMLLYFLGFIVLLGFLPILFYHFNIDAFALQYKMWIYELTQELSEKQNLDSSHIHTIFALLVKYTPLRYLPFTPVTTIVFQFIVLGILGFIFLNVMKKGKDLKSPELLEGAVLITLIPLLATTSHNAFGFAELAVFLLISRFNLMPRTLKIVVIVGFVLLGMNLHDLWGQRLWNIFNNLSLVGVGALLILISLLWLRNLEIA